MGCVGKRVCDVIAMIAQQGSGTEPCWDEVCEDLTIVTKKYTVIVWTLLY